MVEKFRRFDAAEYLEDEEDIAGFLAESAAIGDPAVMISALGAVARARNMSELAKKIGISREGLYRSFTEGGNPSFGTAIRLAAELGFTFNLVPTVKPAQSSPAGSVPFGAMNPNTERSTLAPKARRVAAKKTTTKKAAAAKKALRQRRPTAAAA